ncbi:MAG TPA: 3-deoxy-manno-octulosonate cytidylyltransferase [Acidobacteriota bacterium]|nr:3-deoxy-manno-octulosonate cytidylyltransferase [Acidobacteriota bacterium]
MRFIGVIPARLASTRLPGKPLLEIAGRPLIEWVYRQALKAPVLERVIVAADDRRIVRAVEAFGGQALMTRPDHPSGSDRVAEVAARIEADAYINIQGDEPLMAASTIQEVAQALGGESGGPGPRKMSWQISTACVEIREEREIESPHAVKVVWARDGRALYFSRAAIPSRRGVKAPVYKHLGIYGYRRQVLLEMPQLAPTPLEQSECLEQLRWLEYGIPIRVVEVAHDSLGVDTPDDLERVRPLLENASKDAALELKARQGKGSR